MWIQSFYFLSFINRKETVHRLPHTKNRINEFHLQNVSQSFLTRFHLPKSVSQCFLVIHQNHHRFSYFPTKNYIMENTFLRSKLLPLPQSTIQITTIYHHTTLSLLVELVNFVPDNTHSTSYLVSTATKWECAFFSAQRNTFPHSLPYWQVEVQHQRTSSLWTIKMETLQNILPPCPRNYTRRNVLIRE